MPDGFEWVFSPDKGGRYLVAIQEYQRGSDFGGSYSDDPRALPQETPVGPLRLTGVSVVQWLELVIGSSPDRATLRLGVCDDRIVATSIDVHRFRTPALVDPQTSRAAVAMTHASVQTALAALAGQLAATVLGSPSTIVSALIDRLNAHIDQPGVHAVDDSAHRISTSFRSPGTPQAIERSLTELHTRMLGHFSNRDVSDASEDGYHSWIADPLMPSSGIVSSIAMLWRAHEIHRVSDVHETPDATNALAPLPLLFELVRAFIDAATLVPAPDAVPVASSAATFLIHQAGFEERERA